MPRRFPQGFLWGTAISSFQVEMGRGEICPHSDMYVWYHDANNIAEGRVSGDFPEDGPGFWELYREDLELARNRLGNNAIRLSFDWSRIFPRSTEEVPVDVTHDKAGNIQSVNITGDAVKGLRNLANERAVSRYREILSEARRLGLTAMLTLYHWPIPLWLHDPIACRDDIVGAKRRGWLDQRTVVEFAKFSAFVAHAFGDLVDLYATINEARIVSEFSYFSERRSFPPGQNDLNLFLTAMKNLSMAHGFAYEQVKKWDRASTTELGPACVGVIVVLEHYEPADPEDKRDIAATRFNEYLWNEWNLNAVLRGDYDMNIDGVIQPEERLPHLAKGCDFIGANNYLRQRVKYAERGHDPRFNYVYLPCTSDCSDSGFEIYPPGLRSVLNWAYKKFGKPIYVTENGVADARDEMRSEYLVTYLEQLQRTIEKDEVPVRGYFHWSLMDNYEWSSGFKMRFGLYRVDAKKTRTPTKAVPLYREISSRNELPDHC